MAYISDILRPSIGETIRAAMQHIRAAAARRAVYRQTVRELEALSDRDLADLGISRADITDLAWQNAYGVN